MINDHYSRLKHLLQEKSEPHAILATSTLKKLYAQKYGSHQKIQPAQFAQKQPGTTLANQKPYLLKPLGKQPGTKESHYQVLESVFQGKARDTHNLYTIVLEALRPFRGMELPAGEIQKHLKNYLAQTFHGTDYFPGLKNLKQFTDDSKQLQNRCKMGNHLLESTPFNTYLICTPEREKQDLYPVHSPICDFQKEKHPPDDFQQGFSQFIREQLGETLTLAHSRFDCVKRTKNQSNSEQLEMLEMLLKPSSALSVVDILSCLLASEDLDGFYQRFKETLRRELAPDIKAEQLAYGLQTVGWALHERNRSHTPLISLLARSQELSEWQNALHLYYSRLHHTRRPLEYVLNEELPRYLDMQSEPNLQASDFFQRVLQWFLGGSPLYGHAYKLRKGRLKQKDYASNLPKQILSAIWTARTKLTQETHFKPTLKKMCDELNFLPGFDDQPTDGNYPAIYLQTGLLSLLFPQHIFAFSDTSLKGLQAIHQENLLQPIQHIEPAWLDFEPDKPSTPKIMNVLETICFKVVPELNQTFQTDWFTPRRLDMLLYTLRKYTARELDAAQTRTFKTDARAEEKLIRKLFQNADAYLELRTSKGSLQEDVAQ